MSLLLGRLLLPIAADAAAHIPATWWLVVTGVVLGCAGLPPLQQRVRAHKGPAGDENTAKAQSHQLRQRTGEHRTHASAGYRGRVARMEMETGACLREDKDA